MISLDTVPEQLRARVGPDAPAPMRMMVARALLPMGPADLFSSLAYLAANESGDLQTAARNSLQEMPASVVSGVIRELKDPGLLDFALREWVDNEQLAEALLLNQETSDDAVAWAAKRVSSKLVELVANNQERIVRHPQMVEAIYYNPEAPMRVVSRVFETAVRAGLDLHHIPGFKEIYASIFGDEAGAKLDAAEQQNVGEISAEAIEELVAELPPVEVEEDAGVPEDDFLTAMRNASKEEEEEEAEGDDSGRIGKKPLHALVKEMTVSQKVRLALTGNKQARTLLIKDPKAVVALAVLKAPALRVKEVADFTKNKALSDRIMSAIARNPKWCKDRAIKMGLIKHPKTPAGMVNRWVRTLGVRELKALSKSREVPSHVQKLAKNLVSQRQ